MNTRWILVKIIDAGLSESPVSPEQDANVSCKPLAALFASPVAPVAGGIWPGTLHITGSQAQGDHILQTQKEDTLPGLLEILQKYPKMLKVIKHFIPFLFQCGILDVKKHTFSLLLHRCQLCRQHTTLPIVHVNGNSEIDSIKLTMFLYARALRRQSVHLYCFFDTRAGAAAL